MNSTGGQVLNHHVPVCDYASHQAKMKQMEHYLFKPWCGVVGSFIGLLVTVDYINTGKSVIPRPEAAPMTGAITGFCFGELLFHGGVLTCSAYQKVKVVTETVSGVLFHSLGPNLPFEESALVKTCVSLGALSNIVINRESMYALLGFEGPPPSVSRLSQADTEALKELVNTSVLVGTGAGIGYVAGKGIECGARAVCKGVNLASRGILACINGVKAWSGNGQNVAEPAPPPQEVPAEGLS